MISIPIIILHLHVRQLRLTGIIIRRPLRPPISPISARVLQILPLVVVNRLLGVPASAVVVKVRRLPHGCLLLKL